MRPQTLDGVICGAWLGFHFSLKVFGEDAKQLQTNTSALISHILSLHTDSNSSATSVQASGLDHLSGDGVGVKKTRCSGLNHLHHRNFFKQAAAHKLTLCLEENEVRKFNAVKLDPECRKGQRS